jgi:hypothetical protein
MMPLGVSDARRHPGSGMAAAHRDPDRADAGVGLPAAGARRRGRLADCGNGRNARRQPGKQGSKEVDGSGAPGTADPVEEVEGSPSRIDDATDVGEDGHGGGLHARGRRPRSRLLDLGGFAVRARREWA